ncbi:hypothetical protein HWV62_41144 [Athelia sp. TMB]|nr:hypothetical protein HWV62_41144 [Athelia sp. TMB]
MALTEAAIQSEEALKCFAIPYGAFHFSVYCFFFWHFICTLRSSYFWMPWKSGNKTDSRGPILHLISRFRQKAEANAKDAAPAEENAESLEKQAVLSKEAITRISHMVAIVGASINRRLSIHPGLSALIVGFIGLNSTTAHNIAFHRSLHILVWVFIGVFLLVVFCLFVGMMIGTFAGKEQELLNEEAEKMDEWFKSNDADKTRVTRLKDLADADEQWEGEIGIDRFKTIVANQARKSSSVRGRIAFITYMALLYALILAIIFEITYADWLLGVVAINLGGVPYHKALGIVYFISDFAYAFI